MVPWLSIFEFRPISRIAICVDLFGKFFVPISEMNRFGMHWPGSGLVHLFEVDLEPNFRLADVHPEPEKGSLLRLNE